MGANLHYIIICTLQILDVMRWNVFSFVKKALSVDLNQIKYQRHEVSRFLTLLAKSSARAH